jgi:hypothetical protein
MSLNAKTKVTNSREEAIDFATAFGNNIKTDFQERKKKPSKRNV